jgi:hypothetical protein
MKFEILFPLIAAAQAEKQKFHHIFADKNGKVITRSS